MISTMHGNAWQELLHPLVRSDIEFDIVVPNASALVWVSNVVNKLKLLNAKVPQVPAGPSESLWHHFTGYDCNSSVANNPYMRTIWITH